MVLPERQITGLGGGGVQCWYRTPEGALIRKIICPDEYYRSDTVRFSVEWVDYTMTEPDAPAGMWHVSREVLGEDSRWHTDELVGMFDDGCDAVAYALAAANDLTEEARMWTPEQQAEAMAILTKIATRDTLDDAGYCVFCGADSYVDRTVSLGHVKAYPPDAMPHAPDCPIGRIYRLMAGGTVRRG